MAGDRWAERPVLWFEIYPAGYAYGMGIYEAKPATMARFRQDMDEHPQTMMKLARAFQKQTRFRLEGEEYKRAKGHPQPPLDQWYNRKTIDLTCQREIDALLYSLGLWRNCWMPLRSCCPTITTSRHCAAGGSERRRLFRNPLCKPVETQLL